MKTFEDLQIWKDAKTLAIEIYSIDFKKDFGLKIKFKEHVFLL